MTAIPQQAIPFVDSVVTSFDRLYFKKGMHADITQQAPLSDRLPVDLQITILNNSPSISHWIVATGILFPEKMSEARKEAVNASARIFLKRFKQKPGEKGTEKTQLIEFIFDKVFTPLNIVGRYALKEKIKQGRCKIIEQLDQFRTQSDTPNYFQRKKTLQRTVLICKIFKYFILPIVVVATLALTIKIAIIAKTILASAAIKLANVLLLSKWAFLQEYGRGILSLSTLFSFIIKNQLYFCAHLGVVAFGSRFETLRNIRMLQYYAIFSMVAVYPTIICLLPALGLDSINRKINRIETNARFNKEDLLLSQIPQAKKVWMELMNKV